MTMRKLWNACQSKFMPGSPRFKNTMTTAKDALLSPDVDVNMLHPTLGKNAIHMVAEIGNRELLLLILGSTPPEKPVRLDIQTTEHKMTPLHIAARNNKRDTLKLLLREAVKD